MSEVRVIRIADLPAHLAPDGRRTRVLLDPSTGHPGLELYEVEVPPGGASEFHTRDHPEVLIPIEGDAVAETRTYVERAAPGTVLCIPAGVEHRHVSSGELSRFLGVFAPPAGHAEHVRRRPTADDREAGSGRAR